MLALLASLVAAQGAAAGTPYQAEHFELRSLPSSVLSFSGWTRQPLPPWGPTDADGIPVRRKGGVLVYPLGMLSMSGMRRLVIWRETGDHGQLTQALKQGRKLRQLGVRRGEGSWLPHLYDYPNEGLTSPWYNAMTQGLALSFFVRLHEATGRAVHLEAARRVFRTFEVIGPRPGPWVTRVDPGGHLWLEHYPRRARLDAVLNAHMHAVFGLYEYWRATGSKPARRVLEGAITTIRVHATDFRRAGTLSIYCLFHRTQHRHYHAIHIWQLRLLGRISGDRFFTRMARWLASDWRPPQPGPGAPLYPPLPDQHHSNPIVTSTAGSAHPPVAWAVAA